MNAKIAFRPILMVIKIGAIIVLIVNLIGLGIAAQPVEGMDWHPVLSTAVAPQVNAAASPAVRGTLASFTALIPELSGVFLPLIIK